jgi:hypothetical protein
MQLLIRPAIRDSGSTMVMGGSAIVDSSADMQLHQQQAQCPALAAAAADMATSATTAPT